MIHIILMQTNDEMSLFLDFNSIYGLRLLELIPAEIFSIDEAASESELFPQSDSANIHIVKYSDELFKAEPNCALVLAQSLMIALRDF